MPAQMRRKLGLRPGDPLEARLEGGRVVLTPRASRRRKGKITKDRATGFPVLNAGRDATPITSKEVAELLANFP